MGPVLRVMRECYERFGSDIPIVDLLVFESQSSMEAFGRSERRRLGISSPFVGERFIATHDAWKGTPRIVTCLENIRGVPGRVLEGAIRHEVAHSVLHGSLLYYFIPTPEAYRRAREELDLPVKVVSALSYATSIAVKDFEATRALCELGYVEDQVAYNSYLLRPDDEDATAWRMASQRATTAALCLALLLKPLFSAAPLIARGLMAEGLTRGFIRYLPGRLQDALMAACAETAHMGRDTFENIEAAARAFRDEVLGRLWAGA
ncbi:TPA: hypothetical protein EYP44_03080 [Candidatus Bathyarchaeota archaeon]|nr:hypothetical protein [Candidatus Bathyarchaeota archaeon]